jgi:aryl-alcohol dehydrogenase-like predicted oxidoreductase
MAAADDFRIITKTLSTGEGPVTPDAVQKLAARFEQSLQGLKADRIEGVLVHDVRNLLGPGADLLWAQLERWKQEGRVRRIGFSAYEASEIHTITARYNPDLIQVPMNALDQRLLVDGTLEHVAERGIAVHIRSAFLQGLLLTRTGETPPHLAALEPALTRWRNACRDAGVSLVTAALQVPLAAPGVERVVIGVQTAAQLSEILAAAAVDCPTMDWTSLACDEPALVDPRQWPKP